MNELDVKKTVKKSNVLNEIRNANASLVEYRLFCVYLAHLPINSEDNVVTFRLADYARITGLDRPRHADLEAQSHNLLKLTALIKTEDGGFVNRNLFCEFKLYRENEEWMVSLECNPKIAPMIREQKGRFLRYKLYNTIYLKSYNQQRLYELLKQYEKIGERLIELEDLRAFLSIADNEYPVWGDFAQKVLKVAQKALKEHTDICFDYEPIKKGRKVISVKFYIQKNEAFIDQLCIDDLIPEETVVTYNEDEITVRAEYDDDDFEREEREEKERTRREELCYGLQTSFYDEFTYEQLVELVNLAWQHIDQERVEQLRDGGKFSMKDSREMVIEEYIRSKILLANAKRDVTHRYAFIKAAVANDYT